MRGNRLAGMLFLSLFIFSIQALKAQEFRCGTRVTPAVMAYQQQLLQAKTQPIQNYTTCLNKTLSINFLIVADSLHNLGINMTGLQGAVTMLNSWFAPICLSFQICNVDTIYAYKYARWHQGNEEAEFVANYAMENVINIVLVDSIEDPAGAAGYAPLGVGTSGPGVKDLICIVKGSLGGKTFPHEMGHFFGLYHTFDTNFGFELVNMSNCTTTGDLLCDTPADINPAPIGVGCIWTGTNTDPNGDLYTPILGNIMSYHSGCGLSFTTQQYNRMIFSFLNFRNYLY